jgi:hypothetical protein
MTRFLRDDAADTVIDFSYFIEWQDIGETVVGSWYSAKYYCENLVHGGHSDWQLPMIEDLESIVAYTDGGWAVVNPAFDNLSGDIYWSSYIFDDPTSAYDMALAYSYIDFTRGEFDIRIPLNTRCVRVRF